MMRSAWLAVLGVGGVSICVAITFMGSSVSDPDHSLRTVDRPAVATDKQNQPNFGSDPGDDGGRTAAAPARKWEGIAERIERKKKKLLTHGPRRYDEPQAATDFYYKQRLAPGRKVFPLETLRAAQKEIKQRLAVAAKGTVPADSRAVVGWTEIGPPNIGGRTRSFVINPVDPNIMYAAGVAGGVWKSINAGASWSATDDLMANLAVSSLVMDPTDPSILYAGTGEGFFNGDSVRGLGIFKTTDAGANWTQLAGTVTGVPFGAFFRVNEIVISPDNHLRVYAATRYGVWKSTNGGVSWSVVLQNPFFIAEQVTSSNGSVAGCLDIAIRTDTAPGTDTLLAAFGSFAPDGLFRSTDNGVTWTPVGTETDLLNPRQGRMEIAIAPSDNNIVYVSMADNGAQNPLGTVVNIFRSDNGGVTWMPRLNLAGNPNNPFLLSNLVFGNGCFGESNFAQGWYDNTIKVDPINPNIVWVGGVDLFRSDDGGVNFGLASYWYFSPGAPWYVHADQHALTFHPNYDGAANQTLYSGSDGGLARTDNARAATTPLGCPFDGDPLPDITWVGLNNGYGVTQFYHGDSAKDADIYGGGCQDNGTLLVDFVPPVTNWTEIVGGDGGYFAIDPTNSAVLYAETQFFPFIVKSVDGGVTFVNGSIGITDFDGLFITPFAMDQSIPEVLWTGGSRPWRTTNGALFWEIAGPALFDPRPPDLFALPQSAIAIAPSDSNVVYYGTYDGRIARTTNGLSSNPLPSWTVFDVTNGLPPDGWVSSIAVHPTDPNTAYFTVSTFDIDHVFRTTNGGSTWTPIDDMDGPNGIPNIPAHWIAIRPCNTDELYVGTELGVFESLDGGDTWAPANTGFANTVVETLDFQDDYTLVAFTHGRGAFRTQLTCPCDSSSVELDCNDNKNPDECDVAFGTSPDCNGSGVPDECELEGNDCNHNDIPDDCEADCQQNGVPDDCDVDPVDPDGDGFVSLDCNVNGIPDECEPDCNGNNVVDDCDIDGSDPDGNGQVSDDCDGNGFPDECDALGGGVLFDVDFEAGLPAGWSVAGIFGITGACIVQPTCDGNRWAYAGNEFLCAYGDEESGELVSPPITLGPTISELRFCSMLDTETDFDFADVFVNQERVYHEAQHIGVWENHVLDLSAFAGQTVTIRFRLTSDALVSGTIGWQVDDISLVSGSPPRQGCCLPGNTCEMRLPECCLNEGGSLQGSDSLCSEPQACCMSNGTCQSLDPLCCVSDGGIPQGPGSVCTPAEACCLADGTCESLDPLCCTAVGGSPRGVGTVCMPLEACCLADGTCQALDPLCCVEAGGSPRGPGSVCSLAEACCMPDGTCELLDPFCCTDQGGMSRGPATECTEHACDCETDADCDNGLFCDGLETCDFQLGCRAGSPPCTEPLLPQCDEDNETCVLCLIDAHCDDGEFCNGAETCDDANECQSGTPPNCDDGIACTADSCSSTARACLHAPDDAVCDDGLFCNGSETCNLLSDCQAGINPCTDASRPECDEDNDACAECLVDAHCDDGVICTTDRCDEDDGECEHTVSDAACDDGDFCNGAETCDATNGCRSGTPPNCDDGDFCNGAETCDATDGCRSGTPPNCDDGDFCNGAETCDATNGCRSGTPPNCDDGVECTLDRCDSQARACVSEPDDSACDDGLFCNGPETCDGASGCQEGSAPDCSDAIDTNLDVCDESGATCIHGDLIVIGDSTVLVGASSAYTAIIVFDDGSEQDVTNQAKWRVLSASLPGVESVACRVDDGGLLSCRPNLYGDSIPTDDALVDILVEARLAEEFVELVGSAFASILPLPPVAPQVVPNASDSLPSGVCGLFGMLSPALLLVGLLRLRTAPHRSRRRAN